MVLEPHQPCPDFREASPHGVFLADRPGAAPRVVLAELKSERFDGNALNNG